MTDGARWVVEVANSDGHAGWAVQGFRESQFEKFFELADFLVELSSFEVLDEDYY